MTADADEIPAGPPCPRCGLPQANDPVYVRLFPESTEPCWLCLPCVQYDAWCTWSPDERLAWTARDLRGTMAMVEHGDRIAALACTNGDPS
jgi:hypothetical protein